jgi:hypothetical protein
MTLSKPTKIADLMGLISLISVLVFFALIAVSVYPGSMLLSPMKHPLRIIFGVNGDLMEIGVWYKNPWTCIWQACVPGFW